METYSYQIGKKYKMPELADDMVQEIIESLKKEHPEWPHKKIRSVAYGRVQDYWKKNYGEKAF